MVGRLAMILRFSVGRRLRMRVVRRKWLVCVGRIRLMRLRIRLIRNVILRFIIGLGLNIL